MLNFEDQKAKKSTSCEKLISLKDKLAPVIYICLQLFILAPTVIRAQDDLLDLTQLFSIIFWVSVLITVVSYFITHCADPGYVPLELISLTENSQSSRIQQNGRKSFISQLFKGKSHANFMNEGGETNKINNSHNFKMEFKHTQNEEDDIKTKKQQKYLKNVIKAKKNNFVEFKDEEDHEGGEDNRNQINMDNMRDDKTPPKQSTPNKGQQIEDGNNNLENYIPECELTMEIEDNKQKSIQKSFKFEDSCHSGEKQDFIVGLDNLQVKVAAFSPVLSRNRSFEKQNQHQQQLPTIEEQVASIQVMEQEIMNQQSQTVQNNQQLTPKQERKYQSEKQISLSNNDFHTLNIYSSNSEKQISKEITTQIEDGSTKFTCKTTTQEQFTTQNLEKRMSPFQPFQQSEEAEDGGQSPINSQNQNNQMTKQSHSNQVEPFSYDEVHHSDEIVQQNNHEKSNTFDKEQKNSNGDHVFTDNEVDNKSQRKMKQQTPLSQIIFTNNTVNNPSSMFQFNLNNLQCEKNKLTTKEDSNKKGDSEFSKSQWSKNMHVSKSGDIENQNSIQLKSFNPSNTSKRKQINIQSNQNQIPFVEKRYCTSCYINMPLRAKHCKDCKRCVARFDHHCPYVGNCIGEKNKCVFYWFLMFQLVELLVGFIEVLKYNTFGQAGQLAYNIYIAFCFIIIVFFFVFVLLLFTYHTYFGTLNITTWEYASWEKISYLQDIPYEFGSPFSMGLSKNCRSFCTFRLFQKDVTDPQYVRYPENLIEIQNLRHDREVQLQNENFFDLQSAKDNNKNQQKNNTD